MLLHQYHEGASPIHAHILLSSSLDKPKNMVVLEVESSLFELSRQHHSCYMALRTKIQCMKQKERDTGSLHNDLEALSKCLEDANQLLAKRDEMIDTEQYLADCKVSIIACESSLEVSCSDACRSTSAQVARQCN